MLSAAALLGEGDLDIVPEDERPDDESEAGEGGGRSSSAGNKSTSSGFLPAPPSLFSFTLRSAVSKHAVLHGPWAEFAYEALPAAALRDVMQELTLQPHQMVGGIKRLSESVPAFELVPPQKEGERGGPPAAADPAARPAAAKKPAPAAAKARKAKPPEPPAPGPGWRIRVPRAYFTERFGRPARDETALGRPVAERVQFEGALRDDRQRGFVARMVHTLIDLRQTIALGSAEPGCGKTVMFLYLWARVLRRKCLVIVHGLPIVAQWIGAARRFCPEARVGIIHQDQWQVRGRDLVVASSDTLASRADQYTPALWKEEFGVVCFDEAHHIMAGTFMRIYRTCMHARYCISLTGTPYRKDGLTPAMPFLTGPNAAFMKNTDPVHVRAIEFAGGAQSFVGFKFGPAAGKPNEAAMISAMVEDGKRTHLLADTIRACIVAGRKVLVLCARNDLREALRLLVLEALADVPCPHAVRRLRIPEDNHSPPADPPADAPADPPAKRAKGAKGAKGAPGASERTMRLALDLYDAIYMEPYRAVPSGPAERRAMAEKLARAEAKLTEAARARVMDCEGLAPKVVPELAAEEEDVPAPWIESLNAGDDYLARMNKQQARAILATYVMAREALDIPGLDTLILATPSSDVRQAVGRIRRTGKAEASGGAAAITGLDSVLRVPCALVLDLVDTFQPFLQWAAARSRYYRDERFAITRAVVHGPADRWDQPEKPKAARPMTQTRISFRAAERDNSRAGGGAPSAGPVAMPFAGIEIVANEFDDDEE
jgi:hypothetical protein